jgi:hypothetical protein
MDVQSDLTRQGEQVTPGLMVPLSPVYHFSPKLLNNWANHLTLALICGRAHVCQV